MKHLRTLTSESEIARRQLFSQVRVGGNRRLTLNPTDRQLDYSGIMPLWLPDGIRGIIYPDEHAPAHDERIMQLLLKFASYFRPHLAFHIGDVIDLMNASAWPMLPSTRKLFSPQGEMEIGGRMIYQTMKVPNGPFHTFVMKGNHEDRMIRAITRLCPQFNDYVNPSNRHSVFNLASMMGFKSSDALTIVGGKDERGGFEGGITLNDRLKLEHGMKVKPEPGDSAKAHMIANQMSTAMGHTHREGDVHIELGDYVLTGYELGCLINLEHTFFAYSPKKNWHHGFGVFYVAGGEIYVQQVPIIEALDDRGAVQSFFNFNGIEWSTVD